MYRFYSNKQSLCFENLWHTVCTGTIFVIFTAQECPKNEKENLWLVFCEF